MPPTSSVMGARAGLAVGGDPAEQPLKALTCWHQQGTRNVPANNHTGHACSSLPAQAHDGADQGHHKYLKLGRAHRPGIPTSPSSPWAHTLITMSQAHLGGVGAVYEQDVAAWGPHRGVGEGAGGNVGGALGPGCIRLPGPKLGLHRALHLGRVEVACMDCPM